ncbi:MAG: hypothetical protein AAB592_05500 [Patescibacteria group bacterium]
MKRSSTIFLQTVIVLIGIGALAILLWEPHLEGVNANATTLSEIYFDDPFLALVYIWSIPFFMELVITFGSIVIATAAAMFERILQDDVDLKSANDLTV